MHCYLLHSTVIQCTLFCSQNLSFFFSIKPPPICIITSPLPNFCRSMLCSSADAITSTKLLWGFLRSRRPAFSGCPMTAVPSVQCALCHAPQSLPAEPTRNGSTRYVPPYLAADQCLCSLAPRNQVEIRGWSIYCSIHRPNTTTVCRRPTPPTHDLAP
ncbi:hypothetical protein V8C37DRAFT_86502 [Trichoderma ceciliae]